MKCRRTGPSRASAQLLWPFGDRTEWGAYLSRCRIGSCESTGQEALFTKLTKDATSGQGHLFYYTLHVQGGVVQRIDEHQAQPAC